MPLLYGGAMDRGYSCRQIFRDEIRLADFPGRRRRLTLNGTSLEGTISYKISTETSEF